MQTIKNIFCIGRNYVAHAHELGNEVPTEPLIFTKPTHALTKAAGQTIDLPKNKGEVHYEAELVIKMGRDYAPHLSVDEMISEMTVGLDLTLRELQSMLKEKQQPWDLAKGFKHAAIVGEFIPFQGEDICRGKRFELKINDEQVQIGDMNKMIFSFSDMIHFIGEHLGLKKDDIIYTGTPEGVGPLHEGDGISLLWNGSSVGYIQISG
ncbi:MAG TPA: fumarylacetoacetate hydrolase family protein [Pseudogracilibacillus sp.]|nr:fumarylacetoacetate hydrolase family protein [Pseudogracilibacillus sp.]